MIDSIINHFKGIKNQIKTRNNFYFIFIILFINFFIFLQLNAINDAKKGENHIIGLVAVLLACVMAGFAGNIP